MEYKTRYYCDACESNWTVLIDVVVSSCPTCGYGNIEEIPLDSAEDEDEGGKYYHERGYIPTWVDDYLSD